MTDPKNELLVTNTFTPVKPFDEITESKLIGIGVNETIITLIKNIHKSILKFDRRQKQINKNSKIVEFTVNIDNLVTIMRLCPQIAENINLFSYEFQLYVVGVRGNLIRFIKNQTNNIQLAAIHSSYFNINYINNPTEDAKWLAIKQYPEIIDIIKEPTDEMLMYAINQKPWVFKSIEYSISDEIKLFTVSKRVENFFWIKNPSDEMILTAITKKPEYVNRIYPISKNLLIEALKRNKGIIKYIHNSNYLKSLLQDSLEWKEKYNKYKEEKQEEINERKKKLKLFIIEEKRKAKKKREVKAKGSKM